MTNLKVTQTAQLDKALESAVTHRWSELMSHSPAELVHIEYQTDDRGSIEFLKVWASNNRGHWDLICEMWLRALWSSPVGFRFANHYSSATLEQALNLATKEGSSNSYLPDHHRLIQVYPPVTGPGTDPIATVDVNAAVPQLG